MFCGFCGANLPDDAESCSNCGKTVVGKESSQEKNDEDKIVPGEMRQIEDNDVTREALSIEGDSVKNENSAKMASAEITDKSTEMGEPVQNEPLKASEKSKAFNEIKNKFLGKLVNFKGDKKKLGFVGIIAVAAVVVIIAGNSISVNRKIGKLEDDIFSISASNYEDEDKIIKLYEEYDSLSDSTKRKVSNRETLINAYKQVEALIAQREQEAEQVDNIIESIDYSNKFAEASTVKDAVHAYNNLDDRAKEYLESYEKLQSAYDEVKNMNMEVTADNFFDAFVVEYAVGDHTNYGGTIVSQSGYTINWDKYSGFVTPNYDIDEYNDYATPVHVYVASRYPNLISECSFHINLHQTYNGIGIVDSDVHEFKLQSANIQFDSSQGIGDYLINVEDNDASNSLWNIIGMSYDWSDLVHQMNSFDASRVEITDVVGSVSY